MTRWVGSGTQKMPSGEGREGGEGYMVNTSQPLWLMTVPSTNLTLRYDESFIGICSELGERRTRIIILLVKYAVDWEKFSRKLFLM